MVGTYEEISKDVSALKATPNLLDWAGQRASWDWDAIWGLSWTRPMGWSTSLTSASTVTPTVSAPTRRP